MFFLKISVGSVKENFRKKAEKITKQPVAKNTEPKLNLLIIPRKNITYE